MTEGSKHTPGPWEAYYVQSGGWSVRMAQPREGYDRPEPICSMAWWQFDIPGVIDNDISGANAKLIAAAPDLLEACTRYLDAMDRYGHPDKTDRLIRAAVQKATSTAKRHYYVAGPGGDADTCRECGQDFRSEIHFRMGESA